MANRHKSAVRQHRRSLRARERNRRNLSRLRGQLRSIRSLIKENSVEDAKRALTSTLSLIDHSVTKRILHRNAAARTKSRITRQVNQLG